MVAVHALLGHGLVESGSGNQTKTNQNNADGTGCQEHICSENIAQVSRQTSTLDWPLQKAVQNRTSYW